MNIRKFKKNAATVLVSAGLMFGFSTAAVAGGIPVFDGAAVAQAIQ